MKARKLASRSGPTSIRAKPQERTDNLSRVNSLGEGCRLWTRSKPSKSHPPVTPSKRWPLTGRQVARKEGAPGRTHRFVRGLETLKRKPHERSRSATWLRRFRGIKNVTRVQKNPEDGSVQAGFWSRPAVGSKGPDGLSKADRCCRGKTLREAASSLWQVEKSPCQL